MKNLVISRKKWLRGPQVNPLWDTNRGGGCCLGHACIQLFNLTIENINDKYCPSRVLNGETILSTRLRGTTINSEFSSDAISINDSLCPEYIREEKLISLFKTKDVELTFTD